MDLFEQITSFDALWVAWERVRSKGGGAGGDGVGPAEFAEVAQQVLHQLEQALREGAYWPTPARLVEIPKPSGGMRTLRIPSIRDRVVQTSAALALVPLLDSEFEDSSFAYRPGRSVQRAVARVATLRNAGYVWTVDGDIRTFFDDIPHVPLLERLDRVIRSQRTTDLVERWLTAYCEGGKGLPQGMPVSPVLSNLYLDQIDEQIEKGGVRLVRFADDFLLLCRTEIAAQRSLATITELLRSVGLRINPEKTSIRRFEDSTHFLGHLFVRGLVLDAFEDQAAEVPPREMQQDDPRTEADPAVTPEYDGDEKLRWIYVHEPGRVVTTRGAAFSIRESANGAELAMAHPGWAGGIEIGPAAGIDESALRLALATRRPVVFVASDGTLAGRLDPAPADLAALHLEQARLVLDPARCLDMAKILVRGRIVNQRRTLMRLNAERNIEKVTEAVEPLRRLAARVSVQTSVDAARGIEGRATVLYWSAIGDLLDRDLGFRGRERRPPPDPFNVTVSYLATRLAADLHAIISRRGLHPGFACLHASQDGRASLALDLMEEFRAPLVEGLSVTLFRQHRLRKEYFVKGEGGHLRATPEAIRAMIRGYEQRLSTRATEPGTGQKTTWRGLMEGQVIAYRRHVTGKGRFESFAREL